MLAVTLVAALIRHYNPFTLWEQWDAKWYLGIAHHGYRFTIHGKPALAFFPLFPLLIKAVMNAGVLGIVAGILLSNGAFLAALFYLRALTAREWGDDVAERALWLLALFPTAFFTFAPYTEALFLLSAVGAIYHARRGESTRAGLWAAAAILTRSTGIILVPAVLIALHPRGLRAWISGLLPPVAATVGYVMYLGMERLPVQAVLDAQRGWHRGLTFPWTGFTASLGWLAHSGAASIPWAIENLMQLSVTGIFLILTALAWRELTSTERVYCAGFWLLVLLSPEWMDGYYAPFSSMDRFVLALFPLAGWTASRLPHRSFRRLVVASAALMVGATGVFLAGGWVG